MAKWDNLKGVPESGKRKYITYVHKKTTQLLRGKIGRIKFMSDIRKFRDKIEPKHFVAMINGKNYLFRGNKVRLLKR